MTKAVTAKTWALTVFSGRRYSTNTSPVPVLSSPTPSGTLGTSTTATVGATTTISSGTLYAIVDSAANLVGITAAQIKAGQNKNSASAVASGNATVSSTTASVSLTGLTASTGYSYACVQHVTAGDSNVGAGTFTTGSSATVSFPLAAGHSYTQRMSLVSHFPRPDTDSGIGSWERHKLHPAGFPLRLPIAFQGGVAPFRYAISGAPSGSSIGADLLANWATGGQQNHGVLMCSAPALGSYTITASVTDQLGSTCSTMWTLVVADPNDTTKFRWYDSTNGSNSNTGTSLLPYKDDLSKVFGTTSTSTTFQGHVIFINRGVAYTIPSSTDLTHQTPLDNTKRPVVFYSLPNSGTARNKATLSFASTRIYFGNMSGMYWGELTFDGGVSTDANYQNVLIGDSQDRLTMFGIDGTNVVNGTVGDDNPSMFTAATGATGTDSTYNHYVTFIDCQEFGRPSSSNSVALWDWYGMKYGVMEFCNTGTSSAAMNYKDSCWNISNRYCSNSIPGTGNFAADILGVSQNGGTNGNIEYCYFRGNGADGGASRAVRWNSFSDAGFLGGWMNRCTLTGVIDIKLPNTTTGPYVIENTVIQSASGSPLVTSGSNITNTGTECQGTSGIIDGTTLALTGSFRTTYLGVRGYELA